MRWTYGAGLKGTLNPFEYDIRTGKVKPTATASGKLSAYASLALAEAKSTAKCTGLTMQEPVSATPGADTHPPAAAWGCSAFCALISSSPCPAV